MHPEIERLMVSEHQKALLQEAAADRVAATSRQPQAGRTTVCSTPAWRRVIGSAAIGLGVRLAGGSIGAASELH